MRCSHRDNRINGVGEVIRHGKHGASDNSSHTVSDDDDRLRVWQACIVGSSPSFVVKTQDVTDGFIQILGLIEERLSVKGRKILVEIDGEKVEVSDSVFEDSLVVSVGLEELGCSFSGNGTNLSITTGISGDE